MMYATPNQFQRQEGKRRGEARTRGGEENRFSVAQDGKFWNMAAQHENGLNTTLENS